MYEQKSLFFFVLPSTVEFSTSKCTRLQFLEGAGEGGIHADRTGFPRFCSSPSPTPTFDLQLFKRSFLPMYSQSLHRRGNLMIIVRSKVPAGSHAD